MVKTNETKKTKLAKSCIRLTNEDKYEYSFAKNSLHFFK